jgi:hypothetical protein
MWSGQIKPFFEALKTAVGKDTRFPVLSTPPEHVSLPFACPPKVRGGFGFFESVAIPHDAL